ncbi:MAG: hypothetical protein GWO00_11370 [Gemmatimonadetes bacterium]|nr:hypothetical protein [Gemmatimonadota bacterium]NIT87587.1 hypothetical protein [Gemmatimonadota bacterium]NIU31453.1 hypothetical protein [Gemmatimonadota bacterium]NIV61805.1 hypothetical protein [Gemmatimonadota bacterium]NIW64532.1 hypothetical protein [Gemmatimonadota bacterium]
MEDTQPALGTERQTPLRSGGNGRPRKTLRLRNRSSMLRRSCRFPFEMGPTLPNGIRIRRERRVSDSFSGIPSLARLGNHDSSEPLSSA